MEGIKVKKRLPMCILKAPYRFHRNNNRKYAFIADSADMQPNMRHAAMHAEGSI